MRFILAICILLLLGFSTKAQVRFNKLYPDSNANGICTDLIVRNDGYIMSIGTDTLGYRCFSLVKVDLEGVVVWKKKMAT